MEYLKEDRKTRKMTYKELLFKMAEKDMLTLSSDKDGRGLFWAGMNNIDALEKEFNWDDLKGESPKAQPTKTDKQGRIIAKFNDIA
jgi:predicted transcriptional regulator